MPAVESVLLIGTLVNVQAAEAVTVPIKNDFPTREEQISTLKSTPEFDVLIIGGGATGCGCALDAVTRGLKTALLERDDFSSGTSSRSTKLIHGGVRYLQKAIMKLDFEQYKMVKEALQERANLLEIAPHLSAPLPIMLPVYKWWQLPYYWIGIKLYDLVAGSQCLKRSYVLSKSRALEHFPMLRKDKLVGAIVYYDGMLVSLLILFCETSTGKSRAECRSKRSHSGSSEQSPCLCPIGVCRYWRQPETKLVKDWLVSLA
ncbi:glycerol-3-phosphate dehydrogenase, mitochondrial-like isoform X3 [Meleagris gallopavo]|uniref:glycerol-3-phosphate dehydrogenase, mitochondrial-like isoform X3 n=1 Tax=Meleagris gallopavo TaxID=9103 RepID=UPI00093FE335|nr:glycerol-3-phosphate dehydrogenase, mitochondrial-like isoform X3 [Meleagris gallopavo]